MADTSQGQISGFFGIMHQYYKDTSDYYAGLSPTPPLFMEKLPDIKYTQVLTESNKVSNSTPSMVSGALNEAAYSMFAIQREAGMRAKTRTDIWASAEAETSSDAVFYREHGVLMNSFVRGSNPAQT